MWYSVIISYVAYVFLTLFFHWETAHRGCYYSWVLVPLKWPVFGWLLLFFPALPCYLVFAFCWSVVNAVGAYFACWYNDVSDKSTRSFSFPVFKWRDLYVCAWSEILIQQWGLRSPVYKLQCAKFMHSHMHVWDFGVRMRFSCVYLHCVKYSTLLLGVCKCDLAGFQQMCLCDRRNVCRSARFQWLIHRASVITWH